MIDTQGNIPSSWAIVKLEDIGKWGSGGTPKKGIAEYYGGEIPWLKIGDLNDGLVEEAEERITEIGLRESSAKLLPPNVLLLAMYGSIGKLGITGIHCATNQAIAFCYPDVDIINLKYLFWLLRDSRSELTAEGKGGTQQNISQTVLKAFKIPLPPFSEQRRIVAKIEALMARSQRVKEALEDTRELEKILVAYYTTGWMEGELGNHIEEHNELAGEYWHKYPLVGLSNEGRITERREAIGQKSAHRCKVIRPGDIVFNPIRFSIGSIARYRGTDSAIVSPEYQVFRTKITMSAELLCRYLRSKPGQNRLEIETQGSVRYRVYLRNLQCLVMPIAPPERQAEAERFFLCINKNFEAIEQAIMAISQLEQSILAKAFRGELVPQDPNDEPASVLLERIRAERAKQEAEAKVAKKSTGKTSGQRGRKAK